MKIYKMTATFGRLEHSELVLQPGLNVIDAPNEWGKTTWCAFLTAMLYGLDTRAKSTKTTLADKERYQPWSGSPMAGRIDLNWQGRDITIERSTRGRVPMGVFRAYETASGVEVPELTAANCGAVLLGVEQSVFRRAGFLRQGDMPVTQDEALRRRLNALVTTGDESGEADRLEKELREIKNRCRYNRTGLIPQAEQQRKALEEAIAEWDSLDAQSRKLRQQLAEGKQWLSALENHVNTLEYAAAETEDRWLAEARDQRDRAEQTLLEAQLLCAGIPDREETEKQVQILEEFCENWFAFQADEALLPEEPIKPELSGPFQGMEPNKAENMVRKDKAQYKKLTRWKTGFLLFLLMALILCISAPAVLRRSEVAGFGLLMLGSGLMVIALLRMRSQLRQAKMLAGKYGTEDASLWAKPIEVYREVLVAYSREMAEYRAVRGDLDICRTFLQRQKQSLCGSQKPEAVLEAWKEALYRLNHRDALSRELQQTEKYLENMQAMAKSVEKPVMEDPLTLTEEETQRQIEETRAHLQHLQNRAGHYQGRMEALGSRERLQQQLDQMVLRLEKLEQMYTAAVLGLETLAEARQELQRKFAPRIAGRAEELLGVLTGGRYDRLSLDGELSVLAAARQEDVLREVLWRSDGTMDQLYVALRLAVAEALMPQAPLILDDAFVRFDDVRLKAALTLLEQAAQEKQVILFTCQSREKRLLEQRT